MTTKKNWIDEDALKKHMTKAFAQDPETAFESTLSFVINKWGESESAHLFVLTEFFDQAYQSPIIPEQTFGKLASIYTPKFSIVISQFRGFFKAENHAGALSWLKSLMYFYRVTKDSENIESTAHWFAKNITEVDQPETRVQLTDAFIAVVDKPVAKKAFQSVAAMSRKYIAEVEEFIPKKNIPKQAIDVLYFNHKTLERTDTLLEHLATRQPAEDDAHTQEWRPSKKLDPNIP